jgi:exopolysaccharide biosynthesis predicted pyruvyltransferase EpsI
MTYATIGELRAIAREALVEALQGARSVGLINFPNHGNPGDPAIWLGTVSLLRDLGVRVTYSCASWNFDPDSARRATKGAPLLINGGGNLGDLYAGQQTTRERVLETMRDQRVVQLPQSMFFVDKAREEHFAALVREHGGVTLMARELLTQERMRNALGVDPIMSPDHAFWFSPPPRVTPDHDLSWIIRSAQDPEFNPLAAPPADSGIEGFEWMDDVEAAQAHWDRWGRALLALNVRLRVRPQVGKKRWRLAAMTFEPLGRRWVDHGLKKLGSARVVVTDKLHGHILASLLGVPHVVLDNSYGKVSGTLDTWSQGLPGVHRANNGEEALRIARTLVEETR